jgi:hypothetical protein
MTATNGWLGGENQNSGGQQRETRWLTPPHIVAALGHFDLDPAGAPGHKLADKTYLLENGEDGLVDPWFGRVWLNPPYGPAARPFQEKMAEYNRGTMLIFARTETQLFFDTVWDKATAVLFLKGRLNFLDANGNRAKANAGAPSCLVAYGRQDAIRLAQSELEGQHINLKWDIA